MGVSFGKQGVGRGSGKFGEYASAKNFHLSPVIFSSSILLQQNSQPFYLSHSHLHLFALLMFEINCQRHRNFFLIQIPLLLL